MIAHVAGTLLAATDRSLVVLTPGGVGYEIFVTAQALLEHRAEGEPAAFHTQTVVREDALELYGFPTFVERRYFQILTSIPNLGPKKALAILSAFPPDRLREIAAREDVKAMTAVSGIGQKSAQQIVWDLKHRLKAESGLAPVATARREEKGSEFADALLALRGLGYAEEEVRPMLNEAFEAEPDLDAATAIRAALKTLAGKRA